MMPDFQRSRTALILVGVFLLQGCMSFTQRDYDLQNEAYKKEQQQKEEQRKDALQWHW